MAENAVKVKGFIYIHVISTGPGNPHKPFYQRVDDIKGWSVVPEEFAKIGASGYVDTGNSLMYVSESFDEITELMQAACL